MRKILNRGGVEKSSDVQIGDVQRVAEFPVEAPVIAIPNRRATLREIGAGVAIEQTIAAAGFEVALPDRIPAVRLR